MPESAIAPAAPAATPPPAPAPAPAAKPTGAPARPTSSPGNAGATSKPTSRPSSNLNDAYDQLDRLAAGGADAPDNDTPENQPDPPEHDTAEQTPEQKETTQAAQGGKPIKTATLRQLKEDAERKLAAAEARIKEFETTSAQPKEDPEKKKMGETLAQREKRLAELEDEIRFSNYERSTEYKDKYEKPFIDAYGAGRRKVESFKLTDPNGAERQGTAQDFDAFMRITDDNDAAEKAVELFGNKAPLVMYHREQVLSTNAQRTAALEEYRKSGGERERLRGEQATAHRKAMAELWENEVKSAVENPKFAPWFKAEAGDTVGAGLLEKGFAFADEAFGKLAKDAAGRTIQKSPQEVAKMHAVVRNKAAAFDYAVHKNQLLKKEMKALKEKLKAFEGSVPGPGSGRGTGSAPMTAWAQVDADLNSRARR